MQVCPSLIFFAASDGDVSYYRALAAGIGLFLAASFVPLKRLVYTSPAGDNVPYISVVFSVVTLVLLISFSETGTMTNSDLPSFALTNELVMLVLFFMVFPGRPL